MYRRIEKKNTITSRLAYKEESVTIVVAIIEPTSPF